MKSKPWIRIIALMLALSMTGCGSQPDDNSPAPSIDDIAEVESSTTELEDSTEAHQTSETEATTITTVNSTVLNTETEATTTTEDAAALQKAEEERKKAADEAEKNKKIYELPKGICYCSLGKEENIELNLPYDVDKHFYLIFVKDYKRVKQLLQQIGLKEKKHFMSGAFLLVGKPWLDNLIITNKFFEML